MTPARACCNQASSADCPPERWQPGTQCRSPGYAVMAREPFDQADEHEPRIVIPASKARQGETSGRMRRVLTASVTLAIVVVVIAYFYFRY